MADFYTYRVTWSPEEERYRGFCAEFPTLSWTASSPDEAFSGIRHLVSEVLGEIRETLPEPLAKRSYSGKFMVRVPPETHRELVLRAAEEGVSLNRLVNARLSGRSSVA